jgi:GTPase
VARDEVVSLELARHLASVSADLGRQVGVLLTREGTVRNVIVGDATKIEVPDVGRLRGGVGRFRGLRLVHTHLRGEPLTHDDLTDLALLRLDMVAAVQVAPGGEAGAIEVAYLAPRPEPADGGEVAYDDNFERVRAPEVHRLDLDVEATMAALEEELARTAAAAGATGRERALVVALEPDDERFAETLELVRSAGVEIAGTVRQKRARVHPRTVVGGGKLQEIVLEGMRRRAEVAIFDLDLKPAQARAFEDATGLKAVDRTQLILDIFAQRAKSRDGKLQVELAQLKYSLPRLTERDAGLSRLAGGIGGRGPGETVMEIGRRRINDRIRALEKEVEKLSKQRDVRRRRRREADLPILSIIGYTNAGKSTLLNAMTSSEVEAADKMFQTLDPTSRRLRFPREGEVVITDTVGFLSDLPPDLVAAFRATLEELSDADLLLHVVDAADPRLEEKLRAVERLVDELKLFEIDRLIVLNKADLVAEAELAALVKRYDGVAVSAVKRQGLARLVAAAEERLGRRNLMVEPAGGAAGEAPAEAESAEAAAEELETAEPR